MTGSMIAGAALLVTACGGGSEANNTATDANAMGTDVFNTTDMNSGLGTDMNAGMGTDMNSTGGMNTTGGTDMNTTGGTTGTDANMTGGNTTNAM
jgi:hypothetical protein